VVVVPDLVGLTEEAAAVELEPQLRLANPTGADGEVIEQDPPAGTEVPEGTPVAVLLQTVAEPRVDPEAASSSLTPVFVGGGLAVLAVGAAAAPLLHMRRRWRERRWVDQQVALGLGELTPAYPRPTDAAAPGFDVRLEIRRDPAARPQEVAHGDR
jgi:hypothetical protein